MAWGALPHAIAREVVADPGLDCLSRCDIGIAANFVSLLEPGKPPSIECARQLRVKSQRRAIIIDGRAKSAHLQVDQSARVIRRGFVYPRLKRLIAVFQRRLQRTEDGSGPAASVPHRFQIGIETNCLVIVPRRAIVFILFQVGSGTIGESSAVVGLELDRLIERFDSEVVFAFPQVSRAAIVEGLGVSWIELDRLIEVLDGAAVVRLWRYRRLPRLL